jgi:hypothetical protein
MKISFIDFNPHAPVKDRYEYVIDYISQDFDLDRDETFYLIQQLKHDRSSVVVYGEAIADFQIYDNALHVQIDGDGFWFAENISLEIAEKILTATFEGCKYFGQYIPETNREWEAYCL